MDNSTNIRIIQAPYVSKEDAQFCGCTRRRCALIASWILVIVRGSIFALLFGSTLRMLFLSNHDHITKFPRNDGVVVDISTGEVTHGQDFVKINTRVFIEHLLLNLRYGLHFGFSILLLFGVNRKNTNLILAWIMYFLFTTAVHFVFIVLNAERFSSFDKMITVKLIVLSFTIFFAILSYYKELKDLEGGSKVRSQKEIKVTIVDPMQHHLQPHLQPESQHNLFQQLYSHNQTNPVEKV